MITFSAPISTQKAGAGDLLVWLGPPFFAAHLQRLGWTVVRAEHDPLRPRSWEDILSLTKGVRPNVLFMADASLPPPIIGMEGFPCLTVLYAIDSHIHSWYPLYGQAFDLCLVSLKEHLPLFAQGRFTNSSVRWHPPYARNEDRPPAVPPIAEWELVFAGTVDPARAPQRYSFLMELRERFSGLHITSEGFASAYPKARLILNECTHGELNFRVFEALGCGGCLLTPDIGPALTDLFADGREVFLYPQRDVTALVAMARRLLENDALRQSVARAGLAAVDANHRASHRAAALDNWMRDLFAAGEAQRLIRHRLRIAADLHQTVLRLLYLLHAESIEIPQLREAYLHAAMPPARR